MFLYIYFSPQRKSSLFIFSNQFNGRLQILLLFFGIVTKQDRRNWGKGSDFVGSVYPIPNKGTDNAHNTTTNPPAEFSDLPPALQMTVILLQLIHCTLTVNICSALSEIHYCKTPYLTFHIEISIGLCYFSITQKRRCLLRISLNSLHL